MKGMKIRKIIAGVLCVSLGITLCGCGEAKIPELTEDNAPPSAAAFKSVKLGADGGLEITRKDLGDVPMGEDGSWTIFVYMSGSSLEAGASSGTRDIEEMCKSTVGENVRFVVQTGGSTSWRYGEISSEKLQRHEIANGECKTVAEVPLSSMGDAATLRNFLKWGIENYPAEKMGLILWGHGNGSLGGVCRDDLFDGDYLELCEINSALAEASALMTDKFEFIGFDACYMGTLEAADMLASYARYMIGSEELEPENGWNYTALGDLLEQDPHAGWDKIAEALCDGFLNDSESSEEADRVTLSVIELSKLDNVLASLNDYASELCDKLNDRDGLREFNNKLLSAEHFSNATMYYGYSNLVDLGEFADAGRDITDKAAALSDALGGAVICRRAASGHPNTAGLTVCYPFDPPGTTDLREIGSMAVCPYYMAFIEKMLLSASPAADFSDYDKGAVAALCLGDVGGETRPFDSYWQDIGANDYGNGVSSFVKTNGELAVGRDGKYTLSIAPKTLRYVSSVGLRVCRQRPYDEENYMSLGTLLCSDADWETGKFSGAFDGRWIIFPNGEPLSLKPYKIVNDGTAYLTEIRLSKVIVAVSLFADKHGRVYIDGVWQRSENGTFTLEAPEDGAEFIANHETLPYGGAPTHTMLGEKCLFEGAPKAIFDKLSDGEYYCTVVVTDVWGDTLESEIADFTISGGTVKFK